MERNENMDNNINELDNINNNLQENVEQFVVKSNKKSFINKKILMLTALCFFMLFCGSLTGILVGNEINTRVQKNLITTNHSYSTKYKYDNSVNNSKNQKQYKPSKNKQN